MVGGALGAEVLPKQGGAQNYLQGKAIMGKARGQGYGQIEGKCGVQQTKAKE